MIESGYREHVPDEPRVRLVESVERAALAIRYVLVVTIGTLYFTRLLEGETSDVVAIGAIVLLHNVLAHWVLATKRTWFFFSVWNVAIYFAEATTIVYRTGADSGEGFIVYLFLIIGASAYLGSFSRVMFFTGACFLMYLVLLAVEWRLHSFSVSYGILAIKAMSIVLCGWLTGWIASVIRQTERSASERARDLLSSESTLRTILNSAANPIVVFDRQEFLTEANARACRFLGLPRERLLGERFKRFVFDDGTWPNKMSTLRSRGAYAGEEIFLNADGAESSVSLRIRSYERDGERYYVAVWHDISEQKALNAATSAANLKIASLNEELEQLGRVREDYMQAVTKQLRSPLTAVYGYVNMLLDEELGDVTDDQRHALHACRRAILRAFSIMEKGHDDFILSSTHVTGVSPSKIERPAPADHERD